MTAARTLGDVLLGLADAERGIRFLQAGARDAVLPYGRLLARATGLLGRFQHQGLKPGDVVLLFVRNNAAFVDAFWACQLGGLVPVPLSAGFHSEYLHKLGSVAAKFDSPFLFSERDLFQRLKQEMDTGSAFGARVCLLQDIVHLDKEGALHAAKLPDTALIQFSSGSTSEPKGVVLSHGNLLANIRAIIKAARIDKKDATLSWMPLSHDMGLIGFHLVPLYMGLDQTLMDTELFVRRPARWLEAADDLGATLLCAPNFGYQHYMKVVSSPRDDLDLGGVRLIFSGAEPVSASTCRSFTDRLSANGLSPASLFPVYGLAEASLAVTFPEPGSGVKSIKVSAQQLAAANASVPGPGGDQSTELVCLGYPVEGTELRICDDSGKALPDRKVGHVQIRGNSVTSGYYRCPACDRDAFIDGWLDTGDLGLMSEYGLCITGRSKEVFFAGGQNWFPQDIEHVLQDFAGIEAGKVAVSAVRSSDNDEDLLLVFVRHRRDTSSFVETVHRVKTALAQHTGVHAHAVVPVMGLPRTTSGKLQRYRLAQAFAKGEFRDVLASLRTCLSTSDTAVAGSEVERQLVEVCQRIFPEQVINADQNLFELGADSLMLVRIHEEVTARFPGKVEITDLFDYPTIRALADYIEK
ncbi:non-ribosomal peptide synthetase [Thiogranum longum]